jgi:hypothetical protein
VKKALKRPNTLTYNPAYWLVVIVVVSASLFVRAQLNQVWPEQRFLNRVIAQGGAMIFMGLLLASAGYFTKKARHFEKGKNRHKRAPVRAPRKKLPLLGARR